MPQNESNILSFLKDVSETIAPYLLPDATMLQMVQQWTTATIASFGNNIKFQSIGVKGDCLFVGMKTEDGLIVDFLLGECADFGIDGAPCQFIYIEGEAPDLSNAQIVSDLTVNVLLDETLTAIDEHGTVIAESSPLSILVPELVENTPENVQVEQEAERLVETPVEIEQIPVVPEA